MATRGAAWGGGPVVVDEWIVVLRADRTISQATADRIVAWVGHELRAVAARLSTDLATAAGESGAPSQVVVAVQGP